MKFFAGLLAGALGVIGIRWLFDETDLLEGFEKNYPNR